jgi:2-phospho-L-lactate transferase/gluconeogenesis factor (CofD/UPF0052 family)
MKMRQLNVGCFGGGTGLPSLLGGLKNNPWLRLNAVVTMFDSGGSSGQLRDVDRSRTARGGQGNSRNATDAAACGTQWRQFAPVDDGAVQR